VARDEQMSDSPRRKPSECRVLHTRLLKCTLEVEHARAYWSHMGEVFQRGGINVSAKHVCEHYWFGARSLGRTTVLLTNLRARFDAFPDALRTLAAWVDVPPSTRRLVCHWHLQLSDPLYRRFTGDYLVQRHARAPAQVTHALVVEWVGQQGAERWGMATRVQFASKLLSSAHAAGLLASVHDPRALRWPVVDDLALTYLLYLLRDVQIDGGLLDNPYLASVGMAGDTLERRLAKLTAIRFRRQGDVIDFGWLYPDLAGWADAHLARGADRALGAGGRG
jgi:hypothetical protein